ncbi:hypothetical protein AAC387_Pa06g1951 [Persea americana]
MHVAVDLDYSSQKMFHPLRPNLGLGVCLGAAERATPFITDDLWYGIFAGTNPETFVRADGAFIPFADDFDISSVTTSVKGVGEIGAVKVIDLQSPINSLIGRQVRRSGNGPENWTSGVDLRRLLNLLELDLITTDEEAMQEQRSALAAIVGSTAGELFPEEGTLPKDMTREL